MSIYYQTKFIKKEKDGTERSVTAFFPGCFCSILEEIDCRSVREEEREDYTVDVKTYAFNDIANVYIPRIERLKQEMEEETKALQKNLSKAKSKEVYELIKEDIYHNRNCIKDYENEIAFADMIVKGVRFHFSYVEELWDDEDIIMETEIC